MMSKMMEISTMEDGTIRDEDIIAGAAATAYVGE